MYLVEEVVNRFLYLLWGHRPSMGNGLREVQPEGLHLPSWGILRGV